MAKEKQYVFSARTTEEGLRALNELKGKLKVSWDEMVIDAMCERYGLDKAVMALPKKQKPAKDTDKQPQPAEEPATEQKTGVQPKKHPRKGGKKVSAHKNQQKVEQGK